jgi:tetratricopeptide (TPR) repeat protein
VTAHNNLGDAYEQAKQIEKALKAYESALKYDPNNSLARDKAEALKRRVARRKGLTM